MNIGQIILFLGLAAYIIVTQLGLHPVTLRRLLMPVLLIVGVAFYYLKGVPTAGGDLDFEVICTLAGAGFGLLAASFVRIERNAGSGKVMTQAGLAYAAVWALVLGGRLAFAWAASNPWRQAVGQFSISHAITGEAAWTAAFLLMALAMVAARTAMVAARAALA